MGQRKLHQNPCLQCGACCARYRVSFYWREADDASEGTVPAYLTEDLTEFYRCMRGTNGEYPRCVALQGEVGQAVTCAIYGNRPGPCREFGIEWEQGILRYTDGGLERCNQARASWGLPPLTGRLPRHRRPGKHVPRRPAMGG